MELVNHHGARPQNQAGQFVTGQLISPLLIQPTGRMLTHGVRLRPAAAGAFLGLPASELTGHFAPFKSQPPKVLPDPAMTHAADLIEDSAGAARMDSLTHAVNLSPRQFDRRFLAAVGIPPKAFARIIRFQALLSAYREEDYPRWADLAIRCGFYDQAHLANEFRQFAGVSPAQFFRHSSALALLMTNLSKTPARPKNYHQDQCDF